jgi:hypothetical protein
MKLTKSWLQTNAIDSSYSRGRSYQTSVRKLKKEGDTYTAKVDGSETYTVDITESADAIHTHCTCPYDYGGICKHIVAVGLNILEGNFKEIKTTEMAFHKLDKVVNNEPIDRATFYQKEFLAAKKSKQDAFIKLLFGENEAVCRQFLTYIRPPVAPLSISTDITELSNEIAARISEIDPEEYLSEEEEEDYYGHRRGRYDYDEYGEGESYDTDAIEKEVLRLLEPYGKKAVEMLEKQQILDSVRVLLAIYEAAYLVEDPQLDEHTDVSYAAQIDTFLQQTTTTWSENATKKAFKKTEYDVVLKLILERWQQFKRFHGKPEAAPYEFLNEDFFYFVIQKAEAEHDFLDFMTEHKLHTAVHYELTKKLCLATGKKDFLLEKLAEYGLETAELAKELMLQYIAHDNRHRFVHVAQQASDKYGWQLNEFIAEQVLPTDNLGFFKRILAEMAERTQRLEFFHRWREQVSPSEQEAYIERQKVRNQRFYMNLLADAKRFSDILIFAEQHVENLTTNVFSTAAELVIDVYPEEIFPLYCERIVLFMGNSASSREHYKSAVDILKPIRKMKGKEQEVKAFAVELKKKFHRYPAFIDELRRGGF